MVKVPNFEQGELKFVLITECKSIIGLLKKPNLVCTLTQTYPLTYRIKALHRMDKNYTKVFT